MNAAALKQTKGEETRALIIDEAIRMASEVGFEALTIGSLAERTGLSKSGLFAHFGSKTELQIAVLDEAGRRFTENVYLPALKAPRGVKRLRALFEGWLDWVQSGKLPGGCPIEAATQEYDHQPGPMREALVERWKILDRELARTARLAIETGEFAPDTDVHQVAFEFLGVILAYYRTEFVLGREPARKRATAAFERLVASCQSPR
jgi:AcrR family transcriptional regulator